MTYEDTKALMMECYPSLFLDEADVLHHLFFVNGNGYQWEAGELTDGSTPEQAREEARRSSEAIDRQAAAWGQAPRSRDPAVIRAEEEAYRLDCARRGKKGSYVLAKDGRVKRRLYPICEFADILHVPDDVRPDWLAAARRAISVARSEFVLGPADERWLKTAEGLLSALPHPLDNLLA